MDAKNYPPLPPSPPPPSSHCYVILFPIPKPNKKAAAATSAVRAATPPRFPCLPGCAETAAELKSLLSLSFPIALTAVFFYLRSFTSMLFLGSLGDVPLASGSLAIAFANITGYSILSGLSLGLEPICSQSHGANNPALLSLSLHRSILFLLASSVPISLLWLNMSALLALLGQDPHLSSHAQTFLLYSLPDLVSFSFIHPIRIYLRSQSITLPLTLAALAAFLLHLPANYLLVTHLELGLRGVSIASSASNFALLVFLLLYLATHHRHQRQQQGPKWETPSLAQCFTGWTQLVRLALPSCASVCLEWWWYELMIVFCGLLPNPEVTVASMGILIQTTSFLYVFPSSLGFAVSTRVGNELGAGRPGRAESSASVGLLVSVVMGLASMGFATRVSRRWGGMFTGDAEIRRLTAAALPLVGLCEIGNCPQTVGCGVLRGSARPADAANVNLGAFYLVGLPVAVGVGFGLRVGFCGLWVGLIAAQVCCAGLMGYVVRSTNWEEQGRRARVLACAGGGSGGGAKDVDRRVVILVEEEEEEEEKELLVSTSECKIAS